VFSYVAYGLSIDSALPLPALVARLGGATDVTIRVGSVDHLPSEVAPEGYYFRVTAEEVYLFWEDVGAFVVRGGYEIIVDPIPGTDERVLQLCILGPALGVLLHQREHLVLHASAVAVSGGGIAFLGEAGWGKSTMAAALYARGHSMVADDVTAIQADTDHPVVLPGFPQLKLWPEAAVVVGDTPETLPQVEPDLEKRARRVARGFIAAPLTLRCIYVLAEDKTRAIEPLDPQEALVELVRHSYGAKLLQTVGTSSHFLQCASVVNSVPIRRLKRRRSLEALPDLAQLVEDDFRQSKQSYGSTQSF
jgi:hypothetical protein